MPVIRKLLFTACTAALVAAAPTWAQDKGRDKPRRRPPPPVRVQLLGINDFHGHLQATTPGLAASGDDPTVRVPAGGVEYLATHIRRLERRNRNTLVVSAGDLVGASPLLSALFHDEPTIEAMNRIGLDLNAVGNHEFDEGANELRRMQRGGCHPVAGCRDGNGFKGARFRFLAANVKSRRTGRTIFPPYAIRRFDGVPVGFIGMTLEGTPDLVPPAVAASLRFADEARTANRYARRLRRHFGVEAIVVLLHEGGSPAVARGTDACGDVSGPVVRIVRRTTRAIDLFLTGHTHAAYRCVIDGRPVTSASSYGRIITRVELELSRRSGDVTDIDTDNRVVVQDVMRAPDLSELIARYDAFAAPLRDRVIGRLARSAGRSPDASGETRIGNLVADALRSATGAEAAFANHGEIRIGLAAGDVTYGEAFGAQPFGDTSVTITLTGAQVLEMLKQQWCGRSRRSILAPSQGVTYSWSRATARAITGAPCETAPNPVAGLTIGGLPVDPARGYRVAMNTLLADGGNRFTVPRSGTGRARGPGDTDALEAHLAPSLAGAPMMPPAKDRIVRVP